MRNGHSLGYDRIDIVPFGKLPIKPWLPQQVAVRQQAIASVDDASKHAPHRLIGQKRLDLGIDRGG
jgi:hypothetical protein